MSESVFQNIHDCTNDAAERVQRKKVYISDIKKIVRCKIVCSDNYGDLIRKVVNSTTLCLVAI